MQVKIFYEDKRKPEIMKHVTRVVEMGDFVNITTDKDPTLRNYHFRRNLITKQILGVSKMHVTHEHKNELIVRKDKKEE